MIAQGKHKVTLVDAFIGESKEKKTPFLGFEFELKDGQTIYHTHYMSDKEFTDKQSGKPTTMSKEGLKTLRQLGFAGNSLVDLTEGLDKFVKIDGQIIILVEHEEWTKDDGSSGLSAKVKYVTVGGGPARMDKKQAVAKFKGHTFDQILAGIEKPKGEALVEEEAEVNNSNISEDDVPF